MYYFILSIVKIIDNLISGFKSIATYKEMKIISSLLVTISQFMFYVIIKQVVSDNTILCISIVSLSSGLGNLFAFIISDKIKHDSKWINYITSSNKDDLENLCNYLSEQDIKYMVSIGYNRKWDETYNITIFSYTKQQSKMIDEYLHENMEYKYLREIVD